MNASQPFDESDLHALVDGELDPARRRQVEDHLLQNPVHAAMVEAWRRQNAALRAAFEPVAHETAPLSLRDAASRPQAQGPIETGAVHWGRPGVAPRSLRSVETRAQRRRQALLASIVTLFGVAAVAAALVLLVSARSGPLTATITPGLQGYAFRAGLAYSTYVSGPKAVEVDAAKRAELISWLQDSVGFSRIPDLEGAGLKLLGGRMLPGVIGPAGLLVYERADGGRVSLYFERAEGGAPAEGARPPPNLAVIEWRANGFAFALVGQLAPESMQSAAERAAAGVVAPAR